MLVDFVEHLMPSSGIEMMQEIGNARFAVAIYENTNSLELLANWIFAA